jgi:putative Ca2+/H+ antiporter (TMEM165/GDT1 family)
VAEWGDRSMFATIALGAAQNPFGVAIGATMGHVVATTVAIVGGSFLADYINERQIAFIGGVLFLGFAAATAFGFF